VLGPAPLTLATADHGGTCVVTLTGELDMTTAPAFADCIQRLLPGSPHIVADLSALEFCDSTGMGRFVRAADDCRAVGGWLRLAAPRPPVARVLAITGLTGVLLTYRSLEGALAGEDEDRVTG